MNEQVHIITHNILRKYLHRLTNKHWNKNWLEHPQNKLLELGNIHLVNPQPLTEKRRYQVIIELLRIVHANIIHKHFVTKELPQTDHNVILRY